MPPNNNCDIAMLYCIAMQECVDNDYVWIETRNKQNSVQTRVEPGSNQIFQLTLADDHFVNPELIGELSLVGSFTCSSAVGFSYLKITENISPPSRFANQMFLITATFRLSQENWVKKLVWTARPIPITIKKIRKN